MMKLVWIGVAACLLVMVLRVVGSERINDPMPVEEVAPVAATVEHQDSEKAAADRQTLLDAQADTGEPKEDLGPKIADLKREHGVGSCDNFRGTVDGKDICGPAIVPITIRQMNAFEARWEDQVRAVARAVYSHYCGFRSIEWQSQTEMTVNQAIIDDPESRRFTQSQWQEIARWQSLVKSSETARYGANGSGCTRIAAGLSELDTITQKQ